MPASPQHLAVLAALLLAPLPAVAQAPQRAAAAAERGDLRTAQIEWRNAIRQDPAAMAPRLALIHVSLTLGDGETAEREARAALARGLDPALGHNLLVRAFLLNARHEELLAALPQPADDPGGQVAAGRALALIATRQLDAARATVELARRIAPEGAEPLLAASALAAAEGDRAVAEALVDRALLATPQHPEALIRKATLALERREPREAVTWLDRALTAAPNLIPALLRRAELHRMLGERDAMRRDVDAALAIQPGSVAAHYLRAVLAVDGQDWAVADQSLQRMGPALGAFPGGFLLLATVKRGLGQQAQALDAAQRHQARSPEDPRGPRLIAAIHLEANRPSDAAAALSELAARGNADAPALDLLGRLQSAAGRRAEALAAFEAASRLAPEDAGLLARVAAARMSLGDMPGSVRAAREALRLDPNLDGAQELLAFAALHRGDVAAVQASLDRMTPTQRATEPAGVLEGSLRLLQHEPRGAREAFDRVLAAHPNSLAARLGLARLHRMEGDLPAAEQRLGEALRLDPGNAEAIGQLAQMALPPAPRAAEALAAISAAQTAAPTQPALALAVAQLLTRQGQAPRALEILRGQSGVNALLARAEAHAAQGDWPAAEAASREALAEAPQSIPARQQLATMLARAGDWRGARIVLEQGLRERPAEAALQRQLITTVREGEGLDAALELADRLGRDARAQPVGATLRGELLLAARRPEEAARALAAAPPSSLATQRQAAAWREARRPEEAARVLTEWLQANPEDDAAMLMLSSLDIEAGRMDAAQQRLEHLLERQPGNALVMNNLAWLLARPGLEEGGLARAEELAERAHFLAPNPEIADTLGWILARKGRAVEALPLLRQSAPPPDQARRNPGASYRLAFALSATGAKDEALARLTPLLEPEPVAFPEQAAARRLLAELRGEPAPGGR
jgi:putative PEP-CTERM system TPR-repeat lipoprotein